MTVPILLVTGFLGAGKTTFINDLLQAEHGLRIAAIVNDFGSINIDAALLASATESVIGLKNGCICCSLQGDLLRTLKQVLAGAARPEERPELIVIEASGVADPRGIVDALMDPVLWRAARLDGVVCLVDAEDVTANPGRLDDPLWRAQVAAADVVQLSKTATLGAEQLAALTGRLAAAGRHRVFGADGATGALAGLLGFAAAAPGSTAGPRLQAADRFAVLEWRSDAAVPMAAFQALIGALSPVLLRAKGFVAFREKPGRQFVFQLVGRRATLAAREAGGAGCELVLIGEHGTLHVPAIRAALDAMAG